MSGLCDIPRELRDEIFRYYSTSFIADSHPDFRRLHIFRTSHQICLESLEVNILMQFRVL